MVEKSVYGFWFGKGKPIGSINGGGEKQNLFDAEWQIVVY